MIPYDTLVDCICEYRDQGHPDYRNPEPDEKKKKMSLDISKLFGLFMTILLVTVSRNATVRQVAFDNFYISDGQPTIFLKASKTGAEDEYYEILEIVNAV